MKVSALEEAENYPELMSCHSSAQKPAVAPCYFQVWTQIPLPSIFWHRNLQSQPVLIWPWISHFHSIHTYCSLKADLRFCLACAQHSPLPNDLEWSACNADQGMSLLTKNTTMPKTPIISIGKWHLPNSSSTLHLFIYLNDMQEMLLRIEGWVLALMQHISEGRNLGFPWK